MHFPMLQLSLMKNKNIHIKLLGDFLRSLGPNPESELFEYHCDLSFDHRR